MLVTLIAVRNHIHIHSAIVIKLSIQLIRGPHSFWYLAMEYIFGGRKPVKPPLSTTNQPLTKLVFTNSLLAGLNARQAIRDDLAHHNSLGSSGRMAYSMNSTPVPSESRYELNRLMPGFSHGTSWRNRDSSAGSWSGIKSFPSPILPFSGTKTGLSTENGYEVQLSP